jgi:hypothetical protein
MTRVAGLVLIAIAILAALAGGATYAFTAASADSTVGAAPVFPGGTPPTAAAPTGPRRPGPRRPGPHRPGPRRAS